MADDNTPAIQGAKLRGYARVKKMAEERKLQRAKQLNISLSEGESLGPAGIFNKAGVNELATPPPGKAKYQHRQRAKTWLPTHVWHAKRAHLETKWGFSVVKTPTQKAYRPTHRASTIQGAVAWDSSFFSTIILEGSSIEELSSILLKLTRSDLAGSQRYTSATRCWEGLLYDSDSPLGPGLIYWASNEDSDSISTFRVLIRAHPVYFHTLFAFIQSVKHTNVSLYDCRFTIGSIDITGPSSLPSLASVLKLPDDAPANLKTKWKALGSISNTSSLPRGVVIATGINDPRFSYPPQPVRKADETDVIDLTTNWPYSEFVKASPLFVPEGVNKSYVNQSSQKEIERRKRNAGPGSTISSSSSDPTIPVILFRRQNDSWTVLLPWGWVMPVWHSLMHLNDVHLGGTDQSHQIAFESGRLHFPDDYPGTNAGAISEYEKSLDRKKNWTSKPPGKRISFSRLRLQKSSPRGEIGSPFRSDWKYLHEKELGVPHSNAEGEPIVKEPTFLETVENSDEPVDVEMTDANEDLNEAAITESTSEVKSLPYHVHYDLASINSSSTTPVMPVQVKYLQRGFPQSIARIYKVPESDLPRWLKIVKTKQAEFEELGDAPECPDKENLIGFITTGAFNLKEGKGFGIGTILSHSPANQYCLVRNVGSANVRLAKWERIAI